MLISRWTHKVKLEPLRVTNFHILGSEDGGNVTLRELMRLGMLVLESPIASCIG